MKIKIVQAAELMVLINSFKDKKMPIKTAFKFNNLGTLIQGHYEFYIEKLNEIIYEYGEKDSENNLIMTEDQTGYKIQKGFEIECQEKINELSNLEVELPNSVSFTLEELENLEVNLYEIQSLSKLIIE